MQAPHATPLIFDAHLDLAMNALEWNRDLTRPIAEIRAREAVLKDKPDRGRGTVCLPEMRRGSVGLCVATLIARIEHGAYSPVFGWRSPAQAWAMTQGQLAWYRAMEAVGELTPITDADSLERQLTRWGNDASSKTPIGYVLSLEGADSMLTPRHLEHAFAQGLRAVGPAHYGPGVYAHGTDSDGGLLRDGRALLDEMDRLGMILDVTHLSDASFWEALDHFQGPLWASHSNCRALVPHQRQLSDEQITALIQRGAVIGGALDAWMLVPGWVRGQTTPQAAGVRLAHLVAHLDHICQLAGNARHVGIGSDLDGAFGREQTATDLDTIADLGALPGLLAARGFTSEDIRAVMHGNYLRFLRDAWGANGPAARQER
jgi:membrane dipeptidase